MQLLLALFLILLGPSLAEAAQSQSFRHEHIEVQLISDAQNLVPGRTHWMGLRLRPDPHWHVYWKNPGDSGEAPRMEAVDAVQPVSISDFLYPAPQRIEIPPLTNIGYEQEVILPFSLSLAEGADPQLSVKARWLVCEKTCIPGEQLFRFPLAGKEGPADADLIQAARAMAPKGFTAWQHKKLDGGKEELLIERSALPWPDADVEFFPLQTAGLKSAEPERQDDAKQLRFVLSSEGFSDVPVFGGLLKLGKKLPGGSEVLALELVQADAAEATKEAFVWTWLLFAFLGGLILNVMPCVLPILSIKVFSLLKDAQKQRAHAIRSSFAYAAGILVSMVALGLGLELAKRSGQALGWGFQLQSPLFVGLLALLFFLLSMNFLNLWNPWDRLMNAAGKVPIGEGMWAQFASGVLAVAIASPCTGPFMGAALGVALSSPLMLSLAILGALGLGFAAPLVILTLLPKRWQWVPKPGAWMEHLRQFFAFPLLATTLWLMSIIERQLGYDAVMLCLGTFLLVALGLWMQLRFSFGRFASWAAILLALVILGAGLKARNSPSAVPQKSSSAWTAFDPRSLDAWRKEGPVFIDYTAAWCVTCQVNKIRVLREEDVLKAFLDKKVKLVEADWTDSNPDITQALNALGRSGVPVYVLYIPGQSQAVLLPEILTKDIVYEYLARISL